LKKSENFCSDEANLLDQNRQTRRGRAAVAISLCRWFQDFESIKYTMTSPSQHFKPFASPRKSPKKLKNFKKSTQIVIKIGLFDENPYKKGGKPTIHQLKLMGRSQFEE